MTTEEQVKAAHAYRDAVRADYLARVGATEQAQVRQRNYQQIMADVRAMSRQPAVAPSTAPRVQRADQPVRRSVGNDPAAHHRAVLAKRLEVKHGSANAPAVWEAAIAARATRGMSRVEAIQDIAKSDQALYDAFNAGA